MSKGRLSACLLVLGLMGVNGGRGEEPAVAAGLDLPVLSAYVWRGQVLNDEGVVEPSLTVSKGGFSLNVWGNFSLGGQGAQDRSDLTEIDLAPSYSKTVGAVTMGAGLVEYVFPNQTLLLNGTNGIAVPGTREVYVSVGLPEVLLAPAVSVYYDVDEVDGAYAVATLGYSGKVCGEKIGYGLAGALGYGTAEYNRAYYGVSKGALNDGSLTATLTWSLASSLSLVPGVQYVRLLDGSIRDAAEGRYLDGDQWVGSVKLSYVF